MVTGGRTGMLQIASAAFLQMHGKEQSKKHVGPDFSDVLGTHGSSRKQQGLRSIEKSGFIARV